MEAGPEAADGPETADDFEVGEVLDVQDTVKLWSEAEVVEIDYDARKVLISYLFWSNRYNEWIDFASEVSRFFRGRLRARRAPFEARSRPLTSAARRGPARSASRRRTRAFTSRAGRCGSGNASRCSTSARRGSRRT